MKLKRLLGDADDATGADAVRVVVNAPQLVSVASEEENRDPFGLRRVDILLAEALALVAMDPASGRGPRATASQLSPYLAGLLLGELMIEGVVVPGKQPATVQVVGRPVQEGSTLAAAAKVIANHGPRIKSALSHMDRGLREEIGLGTWGVSALGLVEAGVLTPLNGGRGFRYKLLTASVRDAVIDRLRTAVTQRDTIDPRTALLLSMAGAAGLVATIVPERRQRSQARRRIEHVLDGSQLKPVERVARRLAAEASDAATSPLSLVAS